MILVEIVDIFLFDNENIIRSDKKKDVDKSKSRTM